MAKTKATAPAGMRRCIGSERFGIEAHDAPIGDFPAQPSQKDGLGRMCATHWRQYVSALGKAARERKAANSDSETAAPKSRVTRAKADVTEPADVKEDAGQRSSAKAERATRKARKARMAPTTAEPAPGDGLGAWRVEHGVNADVEVEAEPTNEPG